MTRDDREGASVSQLRPQDSSQLCESLSNEEFIEIYRTLDSVQGKLLHEEFHFVRYLLRMALLELDGHSDSNGDEPELVVSQKDAC